MVAGTNLASLRRNLLLLSSWWEQIVMTKTADTSKSYVNSYYCMWCHNWAHNNVHNYYYYYYYYYYYLNLFSPVSHQVAVFRKSRSRQEIKAISPNPLHMLCAVFISVTFCSSVADRWPSNNWRFWSDPFLTVPNAPIVTCTISVLAIHILLIAISSSFYLLSSSVSLLLKFRSSALAVSISRRVFSFLPRNTVSFLPRNTVSGRFASTVPSVIAGTSHLMVVPVVYIALSGICSLYLTVTCNLACVHTVQWM